MEQKKKPSKRKKPTVRNFLQVGRTKVDDRAMRYSDVPLEDGWIIDLTYRPINFDMMLLKVKNRNKHVPGWWDGVAWVGLHFRPEYMVTAWKRYGVYE